MDAVLTSTFLEAQKLRAFAVINKRPKVAMLATHLRTSFAVLSLGVFEPDFEKSSLMTMISFF